jgi:hypothetical protein
VTHPITPPTELVQQWTEDYYGASNVLAAPSDCYVATRAAQWGADQELEACCAIALTDPVCGTKHQRRMLVGNIRERRRPEPPSLKEQALKALQNTIRPSCPNLTTLLTPDQHDIIRRALEQLDD